MLVLNCIIWYIFLNPSKMGDNNVKAKEDHMFRFSALQRKKDLKKIHQVFRKGTTWDFIYWFSTKYHGEAKILRLSHGGVWFTLKSKIYFIKFPKKLKFFEECAHYSLDDLRHSIHLFGRNEKKGNIFSFDNCDPRL